MNKRMLAIVMAGAISMGMLAGCSGSDKAASTTTAAASTETQKTEAAAQTGGQKAEIVLKAGEPNPEGHLLTQAMEHFAELAAEKSDGRIKVEVYPGGQLGDEATSMQSLQMGGLDIYRGSAVNMYDYGAKKMNIFGLPYLFAGREHFWKVMKSDLGREILDDLRESGTGIIGLGYLDEGARNFFTKDQVTKPEDLKGKKLRVAETSTLMATVDAFGASPTPISFSELYTSLQTGVVDGAEQPLPGYESNSFDEVAKYMVLDGHSYTPGLIVISEITWNKLSEEDQNILKEAASETEDWNRSSAETSEKELMEKLTSQGAVISEPDDITQWQDLVQPVYDEFAADYTDLITEIRAMQE